MQASKAEGAEHHDGIVKNNCHIASHKPYDDGNKKERNILIEIELNKKIIESQPIHLTGIPCEISATPRNSVEVSLYFSAETSFFTRG